MTAKSFSLLLLLGCLWLPVTFVTAQTDTVAFDQARLRIWCETTRFVYVDNGADSLMPSISCQSWEALRTSMKQTDGQLGMLRFMNATDKPAIYEGIPTDESKLQKLVMEITNKLKQSPVRKNDPRRVSGVDSLQQQLLLYVRGTSPASAEITTDTAAFSATDADTYTDELPPATAMDTSVASTGLPWNELLQWLAIALLGGLAFWRIHDLDNRYKRMKAEFRLLEKQVNEFMINAVTPGPAPGLEALSAKEVRQVVKEEIKQAKSQATPQVAKPEPLPVKGAAAPSVAAPVAEKAVPVPSAPSEAESSTTKQPSTPQNKEELGLYYDKMPFKGGFHQNEMSRERQRDSLYTIQVFYNKPNEAEYWISEDMEVQRYAMQNGMSFFEGGCEFTEVEENPTRVVNEQKGRLRKEGSLWKITEKAKVRFE